MEVKSDDGLFQDAIGRLDAASAYAKIDQEALERLKYPKAILQVSIPLRMDDGSLKISYYWRVLNLKDRCDTQRAF